MIYINKLKKIKIDKIKIFIFIYVFLIIIGVYTNYNKKSIETFYMPVSKKVIVIDAGHGAWDPGMVGATDILEKDINLGIALKLQAYLEQGGSTVIMTRTDDKSLGDTKNSDLKTRKTITNTSEADLLVSIHQNSYPEEYVRGAQTFYFNNSKESKKLAELVQKELVGILDEDNKRVAKPNSNYYILKETQIPSIIVECGFLSNEIEKELLKRDEYQDKVAWSIYKGIVNYFANEQI